MTGAGQGRPLVCPWCSGRAEVLAVQLVCETPECRRYDAAFAAREAERRLREGLWIRAVEATG